MSFQTNELSLDQFQNTLAFLYQKAKPLNSNDFTISFRAMLRYPPIREMVQAQTFF